MRLMRLEHQGDPYYAEWLDEGTARLWTGAPWHDGKATDRLIPLARARMLAPVEPSKILCVGRNYAAHAQELGHEVPSEPLLFLKASSSLIGAGSPIVLPTQSEQVEYEGEIGVVIGRRLKDADKGTARAAIWGVTAVNDVTARDLQRNDVQFTRAKSFDSFCPVGPWIDSDIAWDALSVTTRLNGEVRQSALAGEMLFPIPEVVAFMSQHMTLLPGDLISTGTPAGVGRLADGDEVEVEVHGLRTLHNPVVGHRST